MSDFLTYFFTITFILFSIYYLYSTRNFNYWKKKNVPFFPPIPFFGNAFHVFSFKQNIGDFCRKMHLNTNEPFIGFFICDKPCILIRDPELVKRILVKDFNIFNTRSICIDKENDPVGSQQLFMLNNPEWREVRRKLTQFFTSKNLRNFSECFKQCAEEMIGFLNEEIKKNDVVNMRDISVRFTTDSIVSVAFGVKANSFKETSSEFRSASKRIFNWSIFERTVATTFYFIAPNIANIFKMRFIDEASGDFWRVIFWKMVKQRQQSKVIRNDLLDVLIELHKEEKLENDTIVGQAVQFFTAGYEPANSTIYFTLYELAANKNIQDLLREDIRGVLRKCGEISCDSLKKMKYLNMCVRETLRKYPPLSFLERTNTEDYHLPGTNTILEKGTSTFISNWGLHYDPEYFPNPEKFDPLRFTEENTNKRPGFTYLPFGEGPRSCIGLRLGALSAVIAIVYIISEFEVDLCKETNHPIKLSNRGFLLSPISGISLKLKKIS